MSKDLIIDPEFKALIPPLSPEEFNQLEKNLLNESNPESIVLFKWNGILIDGHNRHEICTKHNIPYTVVDKNGFASRDDVKVWIINNQLGRRNIPPFVKIELATKKQDILELKELAKLKLKTNTGNFEILQSKVPFQNSEKALYKVNTSKKIAHEVNVSTDTVSRGIQIIKKAPEEVKEKLRRGEASINEVYKEIKKEERQEEKRQQQLVPKIEMPKNEFKIILADPPWRYDFSATENRDIENHYPTMDIEDICNLKIPAADDCVLFLWATAPKLIEALNVIKAWGFQYKTHAIWDKQKIGMGYYFRIQHELLLIAIKGNPGTPLPETRSSSVISAPRIKHSQKPEIIYEIIEKMYPNSSYCELFARIKRVGWEAWGNEI